MKLGNIGHAAWPPEGSIPPRRLSPPVFLVQVKQLWQAAFHVHLQRGTRDSCRTATKQLVLFMRFLSCRRDPELQGYPFGTLTKHGPEWGNHKVSFPQMRVGRASSGEQKTIEWAGLFLPWCFGCWVAPMVGIRCASQLKENTTEKWFFQHSASLQPKGRLLANLTQTGATLVPF